MLKEAKKKFLKSETLTQAIFFKKMIYFWLSEGQLILMLLGDESAYKLHQVIKKSLQQRIEINFVPVLNTKMLTTKEKYFYLFLCVMQSLVCYKIGSNEDIKRVLKK